MQVVRNISLLLAFLLLSSCSDGSDVQGGGGWIEITSPATEDIYELEYYKATLSVEGTAFDVSDVASWVCCPYQDVIVVKPSIISYNASIGAKGVSVNKGESWNVIVPLKAGLNEIEVFATDSGGNGWSYDGKWGGDKLSVLVPMPDPRLSALRLSTVQIDKAFHPDRHFYTAIVENQVDSTNITAAVPYPNITLHINGRLVASGETSEQIFLREGKNIVTVSTQVDRGIGSSLLESQYDIEIYRAPPIPPSDDASLSQLTMDSIVLDGDFVPEQTRYTASATQSVTEVKIRPMASDSAATIEVNGIPVASDSFSDPIALGEGRNIITIEVTAEDTVTRQVYSLIVNREAVAGVTEQAYIKASNTSVLDMFSVLDMDGDTLVVGAPGEDSNANGESDGTALNSGAVYVYLRDSNGTWQQQAMLKASNTSSGAGFGFSVAISGDAVIVGAPSEKSIVSGSGAAYVFTRDVNGVWREQAYIKPYQPHCCPAFGREVDIDGNTLAIGAPDDANAAAGIYENPADNCGKVHPNYTLYSGAVYIYTRTEDAWSETACIKPTNPHYNGRFGSSIALKANTLVVGAPGESSDGMGVNPGSEDYVNTSQESGAVYIFNRDETGSWHQDVRIKASNAESRDNFGTSVDLSGATLAVGADGEDSVAIGINGDQTNNSSFSSGAAYVFTVDAVGDWSQQAYIKASNPGFGDGFGTVINISGNLLVVGAMNEDSMATGTNGDEMNNGASNAGAAYLYSLDNGIWTQRVYLKASNTDAEDLFGYSVAVSNGIVTIGAQGEDSAAIGIDGNESDNSASRAGAVYVFE